MKQYGSSLVSIDRLMKHKSVQNTNTHGDWTSDEIFQSIWGWKWDTSQIACDDFSLLWFQILKEAQSPIL